MTPKQQALDQAGRDFSACAVFYQFVKYCLSREPHPQPDQISIAKTAYAALIKGAYSAFQQMGYSKEDAVNLVKETTEAQKNDMMTMIGDDCSGLKTFMAANEQSCMGVASSPNDYIKQKTYGLK